MKRLAFSIILSSALVCLVTEQLHAGVGHSWCTHSTAQLLNADVNGDGGSLDAVCHDRSSGAKWVALREEGGGLVERWTNITLRWCNHTGATLFIGDVNGDRKADLICKDPTRIWVDYGDSSFFQGTDFSVGTNWCTHAGGAFSVADQDSDGRADLVCTNGDGSIFVDLADTSGRFGGTDFFGQCGIRISSPPFLVIDEPRASASALRTGDLRATAESTVAGDRTAQTFVGTAGFSNALQMPVLVRASPTVVSGQVRIAGAPLLGYAQTGAALKLVVSDSLNRELCSDEQVLNEQESPGVNISVALNPARQLSCRARASGNFRARIFLRTWASAGGGVTSSTDAHVKVLSISARECTSRL